MDFKLIMHLAKILSLSSVRAQRTKGSIPTGFGKSPIINLIIGVSAFPIVAFLAYYFGGAILQDMGISMFMVQISIFLPSLTLLAAIMYGMLFEFSQSSSVGSSDVINWLPIHAIEFVLASVISMLYFLSPLIGIVYGVALGLSIAANMLDVGLITLAVSTLGLFLGSFILEIVRAITNRVSSSVYKRSGRTAVIVRLLIFILVFVVFMLISNVNFLFSILDQFLGGLESAWFLPVLWPSLILLSYIGAQNIQMLLYTFLSIVLAGLLLWIGVKLREKYWVTAPFAINLASSKPYTPKRGFLGSLGFTAAEAAIIKKDIRGLTRRKEMIVWIAVPIGISVISLFSVESSFSSAASTFDRLVLFWGPLIGIFMFAFYLSLTSIGQEGSAFLNLLFVPLKKKDIVRAKLATSLMPSIIATIIITILIQFFVQLRFEALLAIGVTLFAAIFECAFVGLSIGSRFPDFTEVPRARFVDQKGVWLGLIVIGGCVFITFIPLFFYVFPIFGAFPLLIVPIISALIGILICYACYRFTLNNLDKLLTQS